jgi:large subunit ribosomal protein L6
MSRIGRSPIAVPSGVSVAVDDNNFVVVKGPQGELSRSVPAAMSIRTDGGEVLVERPDDQRQNRALHGLTRTLVANMVDGVTQGFSKELEIVGVGYRALPRGPGALELSLGFSHPINVTAPEGVTFEVPTPTRIIIKGIDKEKVGQVAADIRKLRKPEPYKGKGVRYAGERVVRKAGKAAK